jgi:hypothetical protein
MKLLGKKSDKSFDTRQESDDDPISEDDSDQSDQYVEPADEPVKKKIMDFKDDDSDVD